MTVFIGLPQIDSRKRHGLLFKRLNMYMLKCQYELVGPLKTSRIHRVGKKVSQPYIASGFLKQYRLLLFRFPLGPRWNIKSWCTWGKGKLYNCNHKYSTLIIVIFTSPYHQHCNGGRKAIEENWSAETGNWTSLDNMTSCATNFCRK